MAMATVYKGEKIIFMQTLMQAYAEIESDTPGTVRGLSYAIGGKKVVMEDKDGLVADIREALEDDPPTDNKTEAKES